MGKTTNRCRVLDGTAGQLSCFALLASTGVLGRAGCGSESIGVSMRMRVKGWKRGCGGEEGNCMVEEPSDAACVPEAASRPVRPRLAAPTITPSSSPPRVCVRVSSPCALPCESICVTCLLSSCRVEVCLALHLRGGVVGEMTCLEVEQATVISCEVSRGLTVDYRMCLRL